MAELRQSDTRRFSSHIHLVTAFPGGGHAPALAVPAQIEAVARVLLAPD